MTLNQELTDTWNLKEINLFAKLVTVISGQRKWHHHIYHFTSVISIGWPQESAGCESWWERWSMLADVLVVPAIVIASALSWRLQGLSSSVSVSHFLSYATYTLTETEFGSMLSRCCRGQLSLWRLTLPGQTSCCRYLAGGYRVCSTVNSMSQNLNAAHWPHGITKPKLAQAESNETDHLAKLASVWMHATVRVCCFHFINLVIKSGTLCLAHHISSTESGITGKPDAFPF